MSNKRNQSGSRIEATGRIYLVGIGPGNPDDMTPRAVRTVKNADVVIGHNYCLELITDLTAGKETIAGNMSPIARAEIAVQRALTGLNVAIVTTGDPGIFAIASTFFNYLSENGIIVAVDVIPGVTMANAAASLLGSPLGKDFAVISLSDMASPWNEIKSRLEYAAIADFVIALYNPKGKAGNRRLKKAINILMDHDKTSTPVGIVTDAAWETEDVQITTLGDVLSCRIDTQSILIVGNSQTYVFDGRMITPREYKEGIGY